MGDAGVAHKRPDNKTKRVTHTTASQQP